MEYKGKTAVVTGAASGIGLGIVKHCIKENMNVVLVDLNLSGLQKSILDYNLPPSKVFAKAVDVSKEHEMIKLSQEVKEQFGNIHFLFNNAGISARNQLWKLTSQEWQNVINVNLLGVVNGIRAFLPNMIASKEKCHIINTSSAAGLFVGRAYASPYSATKSAVISLSECLFFELNDISSLINVSVFCPSAVKSNIVNKSDEKTKELGTDPVKIKMAKEAEFAKKRIASGMEPEMAAEILFEGMRKKEFLIFTDRKTKIPLQMRMEDHIFERNPTDPLYSHDKAKNMVFRNLLPIPRFRYLKYK
ncbi:SDR family NAD(P)-dependent oxidoreductase [Candidatus Peregrinibacteria bacterium]|nr:SDR family NAD(P)-dependent oxidoreductase [Candidatus Peregrinibacteria bacterium]